jgi:hypothetical protein
MATKTTKTTVKKLSGCKGQEADSVGCWSAFTTQPIESKRKTGMEEKYQYRRCGGSVGGYEGGRKGRWVCDTFNGILFSRILMDAMVF